jgi:L-ascorbate metabolism protein UlaG (beta-lactamase superfamily)
MTARRRLPLLLLALMACSGEEPRSSPRPPIPSAPASAAFTSARATDRFPTARGVLVVSPLEHASVLLGWDGMAIYVDPTSTAIADATLPKADVVFVTHDHYDHFDAVALSRLDKPGTIVVAPPAVAERTHVDVVLRNGDTRAVAGIVVTAVPMLNLVRGPGPGLLYHPAGRGNGYVLDLAGTRVYFSGDTECTPEMKALERMDVAFVSVDRHYTMPPAEAAVCLEAMRPGVVFPYHDRGTDTSELGRALAGLGIDVRQRDFNPPHEVSLVRRLFRGRP